MNGSARPLLAAHNLARRFGGLVAVSDFSVELYSGEIVGLIGPNGAGKTTIFNLLTGVYKPDQGEILLDGRDTARLSPDQVAGAGLARTFQNIRLFKEMTVLENVMVGFESHRTSTLWQALLRVRNFRAEEARMRERALELLATFGIEHKAAHISSSLPYGEQRKLEIARALAARPRVLLLDEPAAGMNDSESGNLRELLEEIRARFELTILLIEHDMPFVMGLVRRLLVLDRGAIIAQGAPEEVRRNPAVIEAYLGKDETAA